MPVDVPVAGRFPCWAQGRSSSLGLLIGPGGTTSARRDSHHRRLRIQANIGDRLDGVDVGGGDGGGGGMEAVGVDSAGGGMDNSALLLVPEPLKSQIQDYLVS